MPVHFRRDGAIAFIELDSPPVNAIGRETRQGLMDALDRLEAERGLDRVVLSGRGPAFAAGADAREFDAAAAAPHLPEIAARIEACAIPWIAAIRGAALGGGLELALACRARIAAPSASLGLPETTLGVVPGAGGTQRLPRLVGVARAARMVAFGRPSSGTEAGEIGLVDAIADDPVAAAVAFDASALGSLPPTRARTAAPADAATLEAMRAEIAAKLPGRIAPVVALELVRRAASAPFDEALAAERATFLDLRASSEARALRHLFFAERAAKAPASLAGVASASLDRVVVVGGGTMGAGIAWALSSAGIAVTLIETDEAGVGRARANVDRIVAQGLKGGHVGDAEAAARRARLDATADFGRAAGAGLAIEAVFEDIEAKRAVFCKLEAALEADAVLATNTSYLDPDAIAANLADTSRLVGLHFFAPAHVMRLVEIVRAKATSERALATAYALAKKLKKVPVLAGVCEGFVGNRIYARYREAAETILLDGSTPWEIDSALVGFGFAMGPYETQDLSGLDIAYANRRRRDATRDPARRYPFVVADRFVREGRLGRKSGVGWYRYPGGGPRVDDPLVEDTIVEEARFARVTRRAFGADEIAERCVLAAIDEAARVLEEGIARSADEIDLATTLGYGFPRRRGGLMHHADEIGARFVLARMEDLSKEDPVFWRPARLIRDLAATGRSFATVGA